MLSSSAVGLREPSGAAKVPAPQGEPEVHVGSACHIKLVHELVTSREELQIAADYRWYQREGSETGDTPPCTSERFVSWAKALAYPRSTKMMPW